MTSGRRALVGLLLGGWLALGSAAAAGTDSSTQPTQAGEPAAAADPSPGTAAQTPPTESVPPSSMPAVEPTAPAAAAAASPARRTEPPRLEPVRPSLLPLAQPLWSDLTASQREVLAPFAGNWNTLPVTEKRAWAELALRFPGMKPDEQQRVSKRVAEWAALTPEQRRIARANYVLAQRIASDNLLAQWENYQSMTPEQRSVLGTVGNTGSNTAARHVTGPTGLAPVAAQPLPRRAAKSPAITVGTDGQGTAVKGVAPTVGPAGKPGAR